MVFTNFSPLSSHRTGTVRKSLNSYQIGKADRLQRITYFFEKYVMEHQFA